MKDFATLSDEELIALIRRSASSSSAGTVENVREQRMAGEALQVLLERYYDFVRRITLGEFFDAELAQDCTQEVMIRIAENIHRFESRSSVRTWIYGIVKNVALELRRKVNRGKTFVHYQQQQKEAAEHTSVGEANRPDQILLANEQERAVLSQLQTLSFQQRQAILLHYFEDYSVEDAAIHLGCSVSAFKTHLHRGRKKLEKLLK